MTPAARARKRGLDEELVIARRLGGRKMGAMNLPWDVEVPGWMRVQVKKLRTLPSLNAVIAWLDEMPKGEDIRAVSVTTTPGAGHKVKRVLIVYLDEYEDWYG